MTAALSAAALRALLFGIGMALVLGAWALYPHTAASHGRLGHLDTADHTGVEQILSEHGCWTGQAPAVEKGKLPGHVVVTIGGRNVYGGPKLVAKALDQVFNGHNHDLVVRGFCR